MRTKRRPKLPPGSTTARGYGHDHHKARAIAMAALRNGDPCHFCGRPMFRTQDLALDHRPDRSGYRGLAHRSCNARDGAIRGNRQRQAVPVRYSRVW